jgi:hypothetical protein
VSPISIVSWSLPTSAMTLASFFAWFVISVVTLCSVCAFAADNSIAAPATCSTFAMRDSYHLLYFLFIFATSCDDGGRRPSALCLNCSIIIASERKLSRVIPPISGNGGCVYSFSSSVMSWIMRWHASTCSPSSSLG